VKLENKLWINLKNRSHVTQQVNQGLGVVPFRALRCVAWDFLF